jgi:thioredoxin
MFSLVSCNAGNESSAGNDSSAEVKSDSEKGKVYTISLTKDEFLKKVMDFESNPEEWKYLGDKPAIIDFWAEWCSYCRKLAPVLEELAEEYKEDIYIYLVDTEAEKEIARAFGVRALPTLLFVPSEGTPQAAEGALPQEELKRIIEEFLLENKE